MNFRDKIQIASSIGKAELTGKRIPLFVGWSLTDRCVYRCLYCGVWRVKRKELTTQEIFSLASEMKSLGTKRIQFTGGEPLLREDIGKIVDYCKKLNILTTLSASGVKVKEKIKEIKNVDLLSLSLDGPEEVVDKIRGTHAYKTTMEAVEAAKKEGIKVRFLTVISQLNLRSIDFVLARAREFDLPVLFQPATKFILKIEEIDPIAPDEKEYKSVIKYLIQVKKNNSPIINSLSGLRYLYHWPSETPIRCMAGTIFCRLTTDGELKICPRAKPHGNNNAVKLGFKKALANLKPFSCNKCWNASLLEMNLFFSYKLDTMANIMKLM